MNALVTGLHHVTAFAGDPRANRRFYVETLGFALVKRTVNFDAPTLWHLYYGHAGGAPGTLLTHFPEPRAARARHGGSEIESATISLRPGGLDALARTLSDAAVPCARGVHFGRARLSFEDPDGMGLHAEEHGEFQQPGAAAEVARVTVTVPDAEETCLFLSRVMGFREQAREHATVRMAIGAGGSGREIDVIHAPARAPESLAAGTIHHVAWRVPDDDAQAHAAGVLSDARIAVTPVRDRQYFRSIYFRIPGGILFEIATDGPGFAVDEPAHALGTALRLPPQYEPRRAAIESVLPTLD